MRKSVIIIPARLSATRLPRKPLLKINNIPMIIHVMQKAKESKISSIVDTIKNMWQMNEGELPPALKKAIDDKKKDKEEKDEDKEIKGNKTLTGKKAAVVEIDPEPDLEIQKKKSGNPDH